MNLFDVLSAGKRDLNEENVSSFLAWVLNPNQTHGCGNLFLSRLLNTVDIEEKGKWEQKLPNLSIDVIVEEEVILSNSAKRYIDIVIILSSTDNTENNINNSLVFSIENKIRNSAYKEEQLKEQLDGLKISYKDSCLYFLYLTPNKNENFLKAFNYLPEDIKKCHLCWTDQPNPDSTTSIVSIFRGVLDDDSKAKIEPLSNELKFIIKSFIVFAENEFRSYIAKSLPTARTGNKYFKGTITGLDGVKDLFENLKKHSSQETIYIGFTGGKKTLYNQEYDHLLSRNFKWDNNLNGKLKSNWITIEEFIEITDSLE